MASLKELKGGSPRSNRPRRSQRPSRWSPQQSCAARRPLPRPARPMPQRLEEVVASLAGKVTGDSAPAPARRHRQATRRTCWSSPTATRVSAGAFNANIVQRGDRQGRRELVAEGQDGQVLPGRPQGPRGDQSLVPRQDRRPVSTRATSRTPGFAEAQGIARRSLDRFVAGEYRRRAPLLRRASSRRSCRSRPSSRSSRCRSRPPACACWRRYRRCRRV